MGGMIEVIDDLEDDDDEREPPFVVIVVDEEGEFPPRHLIYGRYWIAEQALSVIDRLSANGLEAYMQEEN